MNRIEDIPEPLHPPWLRTKGLMKIILDSLGSGYLLSGAKKWGFMAGQPVLASDIVPTLGCPALIKSQGGTGLRR